MKKLTFITCLALLPLALQAQEDRYDQLTNPKLTSINKEAPRSTFTSYTTEEDAIVNNRANGANRLSLNGKWKFNYVENFADRPTDFMNVRTEVNRWPDINVPGNWELQGFGTPIYVNQPYEFCSKGYEPYWDKLIRLMYPKTGIRQVRIAVISLLAMTGMEKKSSSVQTVARCCFLLHEWQVCRYEQGC